MHIDKNISMNTGEKCEDLYVLHQPVFKLCKNGIELRSISEHELVSRIVEKDERAFEYLIDEYQSLIYNTCLNFLTNKQDAEEVTQDVFVQAYSKIGSFRKDSTLKTWIYRIAITKSLELIRKQKRKKRFAKLISMDNDTNMWIEDRTFYHPGIEDHSMEKAAKIYHEIRKLPEKQQVAFTMHHIDGMSYKETADIMETSISSIESLIFRAKKNLKKNLLSN